MTESFWRNYFFMNKKIFVYVNALIYALIIEDTPGQNEVV